MNDKALHIRIFGTGTSQGIPVIGCQCAVCQSGDDRDTRLRTAAFITYQDTRVAIDIGPDFRHQMLRANLGDLDAILITHEHNDHVNGLDEVRPINFMQRKNIPLYALPRVMTEISARFPYIFDTTSTYPGRPRIEIHPIEDEPFAIGQLTIQPIPVMHGPLPILGFRIGKFCYITDAKQLSQEAMRKLEGLDVLILNALHRREHFSHLNLDQAVELSQQIGARNTYLTHLSHDMGLHADIDNALPDGIRLAYDGLELSVAHG